MSACQHDPEGVFEYVEVVGIEAPVRIAVVRCTKCRKQLL